MEHLIKCPLCKKTFPTSQIQLHVEHCTKSIRREPKALSKIRKTSRANYGAQRAKIVRHVKIFATLLFILRIVNSFLVGIGVGLICLGCTVGIQGAVGFTLTSMIASLFGVYMIAGAVLLGPLQLPNLVCKGKQRRRVLRYYVIFLILLLLAALTILGLAWSNKLQLLEDDDNMQSIKASLRSDPIALGVAIAVQVLVLTAAVLGAWCRYEIGAIKRTNTQAEMRLEMGVMRVMNPATSPSDAVMELTGCSRPVANMSLGGKGKEGVKEAVLDILKSEAADDDMICVICQEAAKKILFLPCKHICTCKACSSTLEKCPICRVRAKKKVEVYL